jgi:conjugative transfer signal peptidase TraF
VGIAASCVFLFGGLGLRLNLTSSYPVGIWRIEHRTPKKGDFVLFDFPSLNPLENFAYERGYLRFGSDRYMPLLKRLAAVPGDSVQVDEGVQINGEPWTNGKILKVDSKGRPIECIAQSEKVKPGMCWVLSDYNPRSFDSRYFGPIPLRNIQAIAFPVFVWKGDM